MGSAQTPCWCYRGASSDFRALVRPTVQYKAVEMSFLRRGNSCVTPDMEIRKRLEVRRYFDKADKDGNGSLTKEEWYNVLNSSGVPTTEAEVEDFFKTMDKNNDGFVTKKVELAFKQFDTSGDDRLNY